MQPSVKNGIHAGKVSTRLLSVCAAIKSDSERSKSPQFYAFEVHKEAAGGGNSFMAMVKTMMSKVNLTGSGRAIVDGLNSSVRNQIGRRVLLSMIMTREHRAWSRLENALPYHKSFVPTGPSIY